MNPENNNQNAGQPQPVTPATPPTATTVPPQPLQQAVPSPVEIGSPTPPAQDTTQNPEQIITGAGPKPKSKKGIFIAIFIVLLATVSLIGAFLFLQSKKPTTSGNLQPTPSQTINEDKNAIDLVFLNDFELYTLTSGGEQKKITETGGSVLAFDFNRKTMKVAYISGVKKLNTANFPIIEPDTAYEMELGKEPKAIFKYEYTLDKTNQEFVYSLRDIAFSSDGSQIAITTTDSLRLYDIKKQTVSTVFTNDKSVTDMRRVFSYHNPIFSPDNSKILLVAGYYEGASQILVNIADAKITQLPFTWYVSGDKAIGWFDNKYLMLVTFESAHGSLNGESTSELFKFNIDTSEKSSIVKGYGFYASKNFFREADILTYTGLLEKNVTTEEGNMLTNTIFSINTKNMNTNEVKELFSSDTILIQKLTKGAANNWYVTAANKNEMNAVENIYKLTMEEPSPKIAVQGATF